MLQAHNNWRLRNPGERTHFSLLNLSALAADVTNFEKMVLFFLRATNEEFDSQAA
jgi:hypothetical protein